MKKKVKKVYGIKRTPGLAVDLEKEKADRLAKGITLQRAGNSMYLSHDTAVQMLDLTIIDRDKALKENIALAKEVENLKKAIISWKKDIIRNDHYYETVNNSSIRWYERYHSIPSFIRWFFL